MSGSLILGFVVGFVVGGVVVLLACVGWFYWTFRNFMR